MIESASFTNPYFYMWIFMCILQSFITSWTFLKCFKVTVPKPVVYVILAASANIPSVLVRLLFHDFSSWATIIMVVSETVCCIFVTRESRFKVTVFFIICLFLDASCELIVHLLVRGALTNLDAFNMERVIASITFIFPAAIIKYLFSVAWNKIVNKENSIRPNWILLIFPSAQMLACVTMMFQFVFNKNFIINSLYLVFISIIIFVISDVIFLKFITDFEKKKALEQELHELEYTRLIEEKHYESIEAKRYEIAKIRHDIKNQIITMRHLISSGQLSDAEELLDGLEKNLDDTAE